MQQSVILIYLQVLQQHEGVVISKNNHKNIKIRNNNVEKVLPHKNILGIIWMKTGVTLRKSEVELKRSEDHSKHWKSENEECFRLSSYNCLLHGLAVRMPQC